MIFLKIDTELIQAISAAASVVIGLWAICISYATLKQGKKIKELEDIVIALREQTTLLVEDVAINRDRLTMEALEKQYETGPFFDTGHSRPIDIGIILVELTNLGRTANKIKGFSDDSRVKSIKCQDVAVAQKMGLQVFINLGVEDRQNHPFSFYICFSGQGRQWYRQDVKNEGNGSIKVSERVPVEKP